MFPPGSKIERFYRHLLPTASAYKRWGKTVDGEAILRDLALFCHAAAPCSGDREEGRRDVWLRIRSFLDLTDEELTVLFAKLGPEQRHQLWNPGPTYLEE